MLECFVDLPWDSLVCVGTVSSDDPISLRWEFSSRVITHHRVNYIIGMLWKLFLNHLIKIISLPIFLLSWVKERQSVDRLARSQLVTTISTPLSLRVSELEIVNFCLLDSLKFIVVWSWVEFIEKILVWKFTCIYDKFWEPLKVILVLLGFDQFKQQLIRFCIHIQKLLLSSLSDLLLRLLRYHHFSLHLLNRLCWFRGWFRYEKLFQRQLSCRLQC